MLTVNRTREQKDQILLLALRAKLDRLQPENSRQEFDDLRKWANARKNG